MPGVVSPGSCLARPMADTLLEIRGLAKSFGGLVATDHIDLEAERFAQPMDEHEQHHPQHEVRDVISERFAIPESVVQPQ